MCEWSFVCCQAVSGFAKTGYSSYNIYGHNKQNTHRASILIGTVINTHKRHHILLQFMTVQCAKIQESKCKSHGCNQLEYRAFSTAGNTGKYGGFQQHRRPSTLMSIFRVRERCWQAKRKKVQRGIICRYVRVCAFRVSDVYLHKSYIYTKGRRISTQKVQNLINAYAHATHIRHAPPHAYATFVCVCMLLSAIDTSDMWYAICGACVFVVFGSLAIVDCEHSDSSDIHRIVCWLPMNLSQ